MNSPIYKLLVLLKIIKSPTLEQMIEFGLI